MLTLNLMKDSKLLQLHFSLQILSSSELDNFSFRPRLVDLLLCEILKCNFFFTGCLVYSIFSTEQSKVSCQGTTAINPVSLINPALNAQ